MLKAAITFILDFHRKKLVTLPHCQIHYSRLLTAELKTEAAWLMGDSTRDIPLRFTVNRFYALFEAMTKRAVSDPTMDDARRAAFIEATIDLKEELLSRCTPSDHDRMTALLYDTCKRLRHTGRFKKACDLIRHSHRGFGGPFATFQPVVVHPGSGEMH
jgi:hypothetical protein